MQFIILTPCPRNCRPNVPIFCILKSQTGSKTMLNQKNRLFYNFSGSIFYCFKYICVITDVRKILLLLMVKWKQTYLKGMHVQHYCISTQPNTQSSGYDQYWSIKICCFYKTGKTEAHFNKDFEFRHMLNKQPI